MATKPRKVLLSLLLKKNKSNTPQINPSFNQEGFFMLITFVSQLIFEMTKVSTIPIS